jgi:hypothetical protein
MLNLPPPIEIDPVVRRIASWISSTLVGVAMAQTGIGFRPVMSLMK